MHIEEVHALHERPLCLLLQIERLQILVLYVGRLLLLVVSHVVDGVGGEIDSSAGGAEYHSLAAGFEQNVHVEATLFWYEGLRLFRRPRYQILDNVLPLRRLTLFALRRLDVPAERFFEDAHFVQRARKPAEHPASAHARFEALQLRHDHLHVQLGGHHFALVEEVDGSSPAVLQLHEVLIPSGVWRNVRIRVQCVQGALLRPPREVHGLLQNRRALKHFQAEFVAELSRHGFFSAHWLSLQHYS
mmetsp:Transcript_16131/g.39862  ORF Transcript_16131/g.39862 Transcript_16131/m.39862 type:complete len:245 (-) Transcript_16131:2456-3190(-)